MLVPREAQCETPRPQGSGRASLAELRRQLTDPSTINDGCRQRLLELASRLAQVRALGHEYVRVGFSEQAAAAFGPAAVA